MKRQKEVNYYYLCLYNVLLVDSGIAKGIWDQLEYTAPEIAKGETRWAWPI